MSTRTGKYMTDMEAQKLGFGRLFHVASAYAFSEPSEEDAQPNQSPFPSKHQSTRELHDVWVSGVHDGIQRRKAYDADVEEKERFRVEEEARRQAWLDDCTRLAFVFLVTVHSRDRALAPTEIFSIMKMSEQMVLDHEAGVVERGEKRADDQRLATG